jgi:hypothetical protein
MPGLTESDDAKSQRLVAEADRLDGIFRDRGATPAAEKAWLTGLRSLVAESNEIERKYRRYAHSV